MILLLALACASHEWTREDVLTPALTRLDQDGDGTVTEAEYTRVAFEAPPFADVDTNHDGALDLVELDHMLSIEDPRSFWDPTPKHAHAGPTPDGRTRGGRRGAGLPPTGMPGGPQGAAAGPPPGATTGGPGALPGSAGGGPGPNGQAPAMPAPPGEPRTKEAPPVAPGAPVATSPAGKPPRRDPHGNTWLVLIALREEVLARDPAADVPSPEDIDAVDHGAGLTGPEGLAACARLEAAFAKAGLPFPPSLRAGG